MLKDNSKEYLSVSEIAKLLGITRQAVHKRIKAGDIKAIRIGHTYGISKEEATRIVGDIAGHPLSEEEKKKINKIVDRTVKEYGEVLKMLGSD